MATLTQEGALLADTFGMQLLAYLCAADEEAVLQRLEGQTALDQAQERVLGELLALATQLAAAAAEDNVPVAMRLDVLGGFHDPAKTSIGNMLRLHAGGEIDLTIPDDPVAGPLALLLRDAFPLMLRPVERTFSDLHLTGAVWTSPHRKAFEKAVLADPDLSRLFVEESQSGGWTSMVYRSTGSGGGLQLWSLPDLLLTNAWWLGRLNGDCSRDALAGTLVSLLNLLRRATRGEPCEVKALVAFTGIVLDGGEEIELPFGVLRSVRDHERELAPPSLEGQVSYTNAEGDSVTASYAGDVVLEATVEYRLKVEPPNVGDDLTAWPLDLRSHEWLQASVDSIRLASLLVGDAEAMLTLAPTWRMVFDPLSWGPLQSWSDPRTGPSIIPRRMTATAAEELAAWTKAVHTHRRSSFEVAIRRVISASASRFDQVDALVDLVIAWENLFGSRQGEPTLRVSATLGWLLGSTPERREEIRAQAARVYALRNDIVHGNRPVPPQEAVEKLSVARQLTLSALRVLFRERTDVLALGNGDERSRVLLMGG